MLLHGFAITYLPQKLEEHHQPPKRCDGSLGLAQFHFFSTPKSGNFPVHCFVLLGVSFIQLKLNRVRAKQCYSISEFRLNAVKEVYACLDMESSARLLLHLAAKFERMRHFVKWLGSPARPDHP